MKSKSVILTGMIFLIGFWISSSPLSQSFAQDLEKADLILVQGKVVTVDARNSIAQAIAVKGDKVLKVGTNEEIKDLAGPQTRIIDLKGKCATPGLIDSHIHVMYYGRQFWKGYLNIRFPEVRNKADLLRVVGEHAKKIPAGEWVSGNQGFTLQAGETLDRYDLDKVSPNNPVYLRHSSGQYVVVNSQALQKSGIDKNTPNPYGGKIMRDPRTKEPTGLLSHYPAEMLVARYVPGYGIRSEEELIDDVLRGQDICLSAGYTSGQDVIVSLPRDIEIYRRVAANKQLKMRLYLMLYVNSEEQARNYIRLIKPFQSDMLTFGGWKLAVDGGIAAGTVLMNDKSLFASKNAYYYHDPETLNRIVSLLHKTGLQISVHVGGDLGIDETLDAFEAALRESPRDNHRHRLEHVFFPTPQALDRMKKLGIVASMQPQWISWYGAGIRNATSDQTMQNFMPLKSMLNKGIPLAFGCDVPASLNHEPKWAFYGAVTRQGKTGYTPLPAERLTIGEALRAHTMGSAYAAFEEKIKGSLEPGKLADIVVWSRDLSTLHPREMNYLEAELTIVGGKVVYGKL